ncbi:hypothetical protein NPIL_260031 [Nephila pilipes]|uniref:Uncharacterized protein n=1 Tax=Nephila pilipes TaxID=299642 RepID=A0A8X6P3S7_NEPPI|nr:hypothetical protein NPIL_260031 [Nephila pilipes]
MDFRTFVTRSWTYLKELHNMFRRRLIEYNFNFADYPPENQQYTQNLIDHAYNRAGKEDDLRFTFSNASLSKGRYRQRSNG